jgi:hypothetical protein
MSGRLLCPAGRRKTVIRPGPNARESFDFIRRLNQIPGVIIKTAAGPRMRLGRFKARRVKSMAAGTI